MFRVFSFLCIAILLCGCSTIQKLPSDKIKNECLNLHLDQDSKKLDSAVEVIKQEVKSQAGNIEVGKITEVSNGLIKKQEISQKTNKALKVVEKKYSDIVNDDMRTIKKFPLIGMSIGGGLFLLGIGLFFAAYAGFVPNFSGVGLLVGISGATVFILSAVAYCFIALVVKILGIILIAAIVVILILVYKHFVKDAVLLETVRSANCFKNTDDPEKAKQEVDTLQSSLTKKTIKQIRLKDGLT